MLIGAYYFLRLPHLEIPTDAHSPRPPAVVAPDTVHDVPPQTPQTASAWTPRVSPDSAASQSVPSATRHSIFAPDKSNTSAASVCKSARPTPSVIDSGESSNFSRQSLEPFQILKAFPF